MLRRGSFRRLAFISVSSAGKLLIRGDHVPDVSISVYNLGLAELFDGAGSGDSLLVMRLDLHVGRNPRPPPRSLLSRSMWLQAADRSSLDLPHHLIRHAPQDQLYP